MCDNYVPIVIIGAGPAGIAAALQLQREEIPFIILSNDVGGCVKNAFLIENLITYPLGVSGVNLSETLEKVISQHNIPIIFCQVKSIDYEDERFLIKTDEKKYTSSYLILAIGSIPSKLNISGEKIAYEDHLLNYEIKNTNIQNKTIAIIGGGDVAFDYALNLVNKNNKIFILVRSSNIKALPRLQALVRSHKLIKVITNFPVDKISVIDKSVRLWSTSSSSNEKRSINVDHIFVAIGRHPNQLLIESKIREIKDKLIFKKRLYIIGDFAHSKFRQISIAMGDGIQAAMKLSKIWVRNRQNKRENLKL
ncbi:MAG: NAD(P)/FAD-dependent oxidoreductase [Candidatus Lokiarchaeota archaeon]|nr:NAD(P)/FAD-dependent oxidoreductase [Candidatus Harpocratesius repetitus]